MCVGSVLCVGYIVYCVCVGCVSGMGGSRVSVHVGV